MSTRATVVGERGDALEMPGVARRAAAYRTLFGLFLVLAGAGLVLVYYWAQHHPQVARLTRSKTPRNLVTEMRLPKLAPAESTPSVGAAESGAPVVTPIEAVASGVGATVPTLPSMPGLAAGVTSAAMRRGTSPVLLQTPTAHESMSTPVAAIEPSSRSSVKVLHAQALPAQRFLLPRGAFLDCTLETAVDSTLPGLATCLLSGDVYGADGSVVLLPRGSRLVGEIRSDVRPGQARVGIIWTEARTPQGLLLPLGAAGTDALGRAGVPGAVDRHTTERFGSAVMLSVIDAATSALVNRRTPGTGVVYNIQGTRDVATEALRQSIHIPPTIRVEPGTRVDVIVAADVDFSEVYQLVPHGGG